MVNGSGMGGSGGAVAVAVALAVDGREQEIPEGCIAIVLDASTQRREPAENPPPDELLQPPWTAPPTSIVHIRQDLAAHSFYLSALLDSGMKEARAQVVDLTPLDRRAVLAVLHYLEDPPGRFDDLLLSSFRDWPLDEVQLLAEALDYLQVSESHAVIQTLQILHGPDGIRSELARQGWFDEERRSVVSIPSTRKTRHWRFWLCLLLSLQLVPEPGTRHGQAEFTEMLQPYGSGGDAITLRRELVEYGLVSREGDGSEYWRPVYTASMMSQWIAGMPRPVV